jgi:hypothetical protein
MQQEIKYNKKYKNYLYIFDLLLGFSIQCLEPSNKKKIPSRNILEFWHFQRWILVGGGGEVTGFYVTLSY